MSRQAADPEMKAIRQIVDVLEKLPTRSTKVRVLKYVIDRLDDPPAQAPLPSLAVSP